ncbi:hypothetical protein [Micromonospora sp. RTGN7]|uniref:hypothetical protein n=1 Tax=Micromonospora sp. RTGN7 TaxID=3016526 RepID=UPI0029FF2D3F|nr:hypothetical protein [Micromonospora sp. RTGN7]
MTRTGRYKIFPVLGTILLTSGTALLATMDTTTSRITTAAFMAIVGAGLGFTMQMTTTIAQNSAEMRDLGAATGAVTLFRTLGGSLAVAIFGALLTRALTATTTTVSGPAYEQAVTTGTQHIFWTACALCALAIPAALAIKEVPLRTKPAAPAPTTPQPQPTNAAH